MNKKILVDNKLVKIVHENWTGSPEIRFELKGIYHSNEVPLHPDWVTGKFDLGNFKILEVYSDAMRLVYNRENKRHGEEHGLYIACQYSYYIMQALKDLDFRLKEKEKGECMNNYPQWICGDCGARHGNRSSAWNNDTCDICKKERRSHRA